MAVVVDGWRRKVMRSFHRSGLKVRRECRPVIPFSTDL